jgi:hypothetical protein
MQLQSPSRPRTQFRRLAHPFLVATMAGAIGLGIGAQTMSANAATTVGASTR